MNGDIPPALLNTHTNAHTHTGSHTCTLTHMRAHAHMHAQSCILFIYSSALPGTKIHPWSNKINSVWSFDRMNDQTVSFVLMAVEASVETICAWARVRVSASAGAHSRACPCLSGVSAYPFISGNSPLPAFPSPAVRVRLNQSEPPGFVFPIASDTAGHRRGHRFTSHPHRGHISWLLWGMSGPTWRVRVVGVFLFF